MNSTIDLTEGNDPTITIHVTVRPGQLVDDDVLEWVVKGTDTGGTVSEPDVDGIKPFIRLETGDLGWDLDDAPDPEPTVPHVRDVTVTLDAVDVPPPGNYTYRIDRIRDGRRFTLVQPQSFTVRPV